MTALTLKPHGSYVQRTQIKVGTRFAFLTTIGECYWEPHTAPSRQGQHQKFVDCQCDCGNIRKRACVPSLVAGHLISCGCKRGHTMRGKARKHGDCINKTVSRLYRIWRGMIVRCSHANHPSAKHYFHKGIKVCCQWKEFAGFREWATASGYTDKLSLDRINADEHYCPLNCQWISLSENVRRANAARKSREDWMVREILRLTARIDVLENQLKGSQ